MAQPVPLPETVHTAKDGRTFRVRRARPEDAGAMLRYVGALFEEPELPVLYSPGEFSMTLAEEQEFIRKHEAPNNLFLLALAGHEVIGSLGFQAGTKVRDRHAGTFGVSTAKDWRGVGVGSALLGRLISWAEEHPEIERIGLEVFETNSDAIRFYQRFGFQAEGRLRNAVRMGDRRVDTIQMGLLLQPKGGACSTS